MCCHEKYTIALFASFAIAIARPRTRALFASAAPYSCRPVTHTHTHIWSVHRDYGVGVFSFRNADSLCAPSGVHCLLHIRAVPHGLPSRSRAGVSL
eukprot:1021053-Prymnesium_polylepis.1